MNNLSEPQRKKLFGAALQYFFPWRAVWNNNSMTTACRLVFDASMPTKSGKSLNQIVAKGENTMAKLVEVVIRWFMRRIGLHTDVMKMYNSVKLVESDWCYQMYLWQNELDPNKEPEEKVIKTLIYGVKSSGNQAELGLKETAKLKKEEYPRVFEIATEEIYVDDCLSGEDSIEEAFQTADQMQLVFSETGFYLKDFTFSGRAPPKDLSRDGQSINVAGYRWYSETDKIQLNVGEVNFASKERGRLPNTIDAKLVPLILTRKHCHSQVARIYDITGLLTPITAGMKEDLHDFVDRGIPWKGQIPDNLQHV